jgi:mono/diheme cytochrome c family protein
VGLVRDGALVGVPPKLLFCRDTNGDGVCDEQTVIETDYGVNNNPEYQANGLLHNIDNWIYSAAYDKRFRFENGKWIADTIADAGQWGMTQDNFGRMYFNSNSDHLRGAIIGAQYVERNPHHRGAGANERIARDQTVWPAHNTAENRGYLPNFLRPDGTLRNFTAACAPWIYRGGLFPAEFDQNAFVCEASANVVRRDVINESDGIPSAHNAYSNGEFIASTYERFRPVNLYDGPDGALYVLDMHHGIIQHKLSLTRYNRGNYLQRDLHKYLMTGRIFRILPDGAKPFERPHLSRAKLSELVATLEHPNGWWRDTAQRLLVERGDYHALPLLKKLRATSNNPLARLHAIWTLEGLHIVEPSTAVAALADPEPKLRAAAIRICEPLLSSPRRSEILSRVLKLVDDRDSGIRLQLALSLSPIGIAETDAAMERLLREDLENVYLRDAVISGLRGRELELLDRLTKSGDWNTESPAIDGLFKTLAGCIVAEASPKRVARLLDMVAQEPPQLSWRQLAILDGFPAPVARRRARAIMLDAEPSWVSSSNAPANEKLRMATTRMFATVHWPGQVGYVPPPPPKPLTAEQQALFQTGKVVYTATCAQCHKPHGRGLEGTAPPLLGSEWVLGPPTRLVRIVLCGLHGPVTVDGHTHSLEMPSLAVLRDQEIAGVLTYIRREWDHEGAPVEPEMVQKIRSEIGGRTMPWTEPELLKVR